VINERARWRARPEGLRFGSSLALSFQRYLVADAPSLPAIPTSLGAVRPAKIGRDRFMLPLHPGEAVWLGIEFAQANDTIQLIVGDPPQWHEFTFEGSASRGVEMIAALPGPHGALRFGASSGQCAAIDLGAGPKQSGRARVEFVDPETFAQRTGRQAPGPPRREDGYGGWRLP
jgi:hypothetical protein